MMTIPSTLPLAAPAATDTVSAASGRSADGEHGAEFGKVLDDTLRDLADPAPESDTESATATGAQSTTADGAETSTPQDTAPATAEELAMLLAQLQTPAISSTAAAAGSAAGSAGATPVEAANVPTGAPALPSAALGSEPAAAATQDTTTPLPGTTTGAPDAPATDLDGAGGTGFPPAPSAVDEPAGSPAPLNGQPVPSAAGAAATPGTGPTTTDPAAPAPSTTTTAIDGADATTAGPASTQAVPTTAPANTTESTDTTAATATAPSDATETTAPTMASARSGEPAGDQGSDGAGSGSSTSTDPTAQGAAAPAANAATSDGTGAGATNDPGGPVAAARAEAAAGTAAASAETPGDATAERLLRLSELLDAAQATLRNQRPERLVLELHPAELGSVTVDLRLDGEQVNVLMRTSTPTGAERLGAALDQLRQALESAGVGVGDLGLDNGSNGRSTGGDPEGDRAGAVPGHRGAAMVADTPAASRRRDTASLPHTSTGRLAVDL